MKLLTCPFKWNGGSGVCTSDCVLYDEANRCVLRRSQTELVKMISEQAYRLGELQMKLNLSEDAAFLEAQRHEIETLRRRLDEAERNRRME